MNLKKTHKVKITLNSLLWENTDSWKAKFLVCVAHRPGRDSDYRQVEQTTISVGNNRKVKPEIVLQNLSVLDLFQETLEQMKLVFSDRVSRKIIQNGYRIGAVNFEAGPVEDEIDQFYS